MAPETLVRRAEQIGLDGVAITDHNTMNGIPLARQAATGDLIVIPGEEIDTPEGQIIGLFLSEPIDPWQSPEIVIDQIHDQGGVAVAPHPFDAMREGLTTIDKHVEALDAIETINSRCLRSRYNEQATAFATEHNLPATGGSDAHFASELGTAFTEVRTDSDTLGEAKQALLTGQMAPKGERGSPLVHAGTKGVKLYNRVRQL
jgi:predicted metal-dependent phosphoesterase TrpH